MHKTIICNPLKFDNKFKKWEEETTEKYKQSLNKNEIYCHIDFFKIVIDNIKHDNNNHYILYHENDGGIFNEPDDDDGVW